MRLHGVLDPKRFLRGEAKRERNKLPEFFQVRRQAAGRRRLACVPMSAMHRRASKVVKCLSSHTIRSATSCPRNAARRPSASAARRARSRSSTSSSPMRRLAHVRASSTRRCVDGARDLRLIRAGPIKSRVGRPAVLCVAQGAAAKQRRRRRKACAQVACLHDVDSAGRLRLPYAVAMRPAVMTRCLVIIRSDSGLITVAPLSLLGGRLAGGWLARHCLAGSSGKVLL